MKSLDGEEATYLLPTVIGLASQEQILDSRFTPEAPNNIIVSTSEDGQVSGIWGFWDSGAHYSTVKYSTYKYITVRSVD